MSRVRRALDYLLELHPTFDLLEVDWQIQPADWLVAPVGRAAWAGSWVLVRLGQPSLRIEIEPAWAVWQFAIWRQTGAVHGVDHEGAVIDPPLYVPGD